jgi:hypothetical protein
MISANDLKLPVAAMVESKALTREIGILEGLAHTNESEESRKRDRLGISDPQISYEAKVTLKCDQFSFIDEIPFQLTPEVAKAIIKDKKGRRDSCDAYINKFIKDTSESLKEDMDSIHVHILIQMLTDLGFRKDKLCISGREYELQLFCSHQVKHVIDWYGHSMDLLWGFWDTFECDNGYGYINTVFCLDTQTSNTVPHIIEALNRLYTFMMDMIRNEELTIMEIKPAHMNPRRKG